MQAEQGCWCYCCGWPGQDGVEVVGQVGCVADVVDVVALEAFFDAWQVAVVERVSGIAVRDPER